jgi:hypothetical protein
MAVVNHTAYCDMAKNYFRKKFYSAGPNKWNAHGGGSLGLYLAYLLHV